MGKEDYISGSNPNKILLGRWKFLKAEGWVPFGEGVTLTFLPDGTLASSIHTDDADQEMQLSYIALGENIIVTEAPRSKFERLKFSFDSAGDLILELREGKVWFRHA